MTCATSSTVPMRFCGVRATRRLTRCSGGILRGARRLDDAGRDRVDVDVELRPLDGERLGHVLDARARRAGVHHAGKAARDVGDDVDDAAARAGIMARVATSRVM